MSYKEDFESNAQIVKWSVKKIITTFGLFIIGGIVVLGILGFFFGLIGETAKLTKDEFGPKAILAKYEWFKDAAAQLDKKKADIEVYRKRIDSQDQAYTGKSRWEWPRDEREQRGVWESELAGVTASYNALAAEYNSNHAKINWIFADIGSLPKGASTLLSREVKPYVQ